jgi:hypothetical protein
MQDGGSRCYCSRLVRGLFSKFEPPHHRSFLSTSALTYHPYSIILRTKNRLAIGGSLSRAVNNIARNLAPSGGSHDVRHATSLLMWNCERRQFNTHNRNVKEPSADHLESHPDAQPKKSEFMYSSHMWPVSHLPKLSHKRSPSTTCSSA